MTPPNLPSAQLRENHITLKDESHADAALSSVVVTHDYSDFDAVASLIAARKLYPGARAMLGRSVLPSVHNFLALHRDHFEFEPYHNLDASSVTRMIVVDVRSADRLNAFEALVERARQGDPGLDVHIWDHHPVGDPELMLRGSLEVIEPVGAAVTLLIEEMRRRDVEIDPIEATLFALGIYTDTGSLTYAGTTFRDAKAVAWLLEQGARLPVIARYLNRPMSGQQPEVLARMLGGCELHVLGGVKIAIFTIELEGFVEGLAEVVDELMKVEGHPAIFALFQVKKKDVQVIARSQVKHLDVGSIVAALGGGGHAGAAAARLKGRTLGEVESMLREALMRQPPRPALVSDLMSSPVRCVPPEMSLGELSRSLTTWQHTGVPVVRDSQLIGIISKRDVRKARERNMLHLPVSSCMTHQVKSIGPRAAVEEALEEMARSHVGRLPVVGNNTILGIITRSDLMRALYEPDTESAEEGSQA